MTSETSIDKAREKAWAMEGDNKPKQALNLLMQIAERNPDSWTVQNLILDDIIRIGKQYGYWDEAITACRKRAEEWRFDTRQYEHFVTEEQACILDKDGRYVEATELRANYERQWGSDSRTLLVHAQRFLELEARDKA
jgi:hypothetical protein